MAKSKSNSFVLELKLEPEKFQIDKLETIFRACQKVYNTSVKHYKQILKRLFQDDRYIKVKETIKNSKDKKEINKSFKEISNLMKEYKLMEYDIHEFMGKQKINSFNGCVGINIIQKQGTALFRAINKVVFSLKENDIHYRKRGQTVSFEDKKVNTGIIFKKDKHIVKINKMSIKVKPIRTSDTYAREALTHKIKYCRIVRKPFNNSYKYFLQIVLEGTPPVKHSLGNGLCGIDEGTSTVAYYNDTEADFIVLADKVDKYNKEIIKWMRILERRRRLNNLDNYNPDGTIKKGKRFKLTKGYIKALMKLKSAYRKKAAYIKQSHNILVNRIISQCDTIIKEPMNFSRLAKRSSKQAQRNEKLSEIKKKDGTVKQIHKFNKKKRFGKSCQSRSPGLFDTILETKLTRLGGTIIEIDLKEYKASKYNHVTRQETKCELSDRIKVINGIKVQRDLYSSFLLYCIKNIKEIDFEKCDELFEDFLRKQKNVIEKIKAIGDTTHNFGLKKII